MAYVLVLEIDATRRAILRQAFEAVGKEVVDASDSGPAILRVMDDAPEIIIVDEEMPPFEGLDLVPLLRRMTEAPIIATGSADQTNLVKTLLEGADMYVTRPYNTRVILARATALVRRARLNAEARDAE
ncbi:MAG: response regulator [Chloroflexi bacterium]|nr:response regulator [Chloroflexota bacterium]